MFEKRTRLIKAKAKELLLADENYITLIFANIVSAFAVVLPFIAYYILYGFIDENYLILAFLMIEIFFSFPVSFGMIRVAGLAQKKSDAELVCVFHSFVSIKNYFKVIILGFIQIFKHLIPILLGSVLAHLIVYLCKIPGDLSIWVIIAFVLVIYGLFLPLIGRFYLVNFLAVADDMRIGKAIKLSWGYTRKNVRFLIAFSLKMIPLLIVSIAAICVPLVIYTVPFLFCTYAVSCGKLILSQKQNDICPEDIAEGVEEINEQDS